jgi:transposase InsO family protein
MRQVWCADVTYIQTRRGFLYLVAIMDWFSRKVLAWRLSNAMDADFCVAALEEAIDRFGPDISNTDQGSQFTSFAFTNTLKDADIRISMDGRGRWMDNVFIERLWRSLKYECVFLNVPSRLAARQEAVSDVGSTIIMPIGPTRPSAAGRPTRSMLRRQTRRNWRRNQPRIYLSQAAMLSRKPGPPHIKVLQFLVTGYGIIIDFRNRRAQILPLSALNLSGESRLRVRAKGDSF